MFDAFDHTGVAEFSFAVPVVFRAAEQAARQIKGMEVTESNPIAGHLLISTRASALSWGERVSLSVLEAGPGRSRLQIGSAAKTVLGTTTHVRNRKNLERFISGISRVLEQHGVEWTAELGPSSPSAMPRPDSEDVGSRLSKLDDLKAKGLITDKEHQARREAILGEI
jgi:hypothetical protein